MRYGSEAIIDHKSQQTVIFSFKLINGYFSAIIGSSVYFSNRIPPLIY